jgi:hypothetical protein
MKSRYCAVTRAPGEQGLDRFNDKSVAENFLPAGKAAQEKKTRRGRVPEQENSK